MKALLVLCGCLGWLTIAQAQGSQATSSPTWPQVVQVIERLNGSNSLLEVEQVLRANSSVVTDAAIDPLFASVLQSSQLTQAQTIIVRLAQETFREVRVAGVELAAEGLAVRVTILELTAAPTEADLRAVFLKRRDVTSSPRLDAAFARLAAQPDANASAMQEIATAFHEANQSPDAAVSRLRRLAGTPTTSPGSTIPSTAGGGCVIVAIGRSLALHNDCRGRRRQHHDGLPRDRTQTAPSVRGSIRSVPSAAGSPARLPRPDAGLRKAARWSSRAPMGSGPKCRFSGAAIPSCFPTNRAGGFWERIR